MTEDAVRTTQLRRYVLREGVLPTFLPWWHERLVPARLAHGFTIEFAYSLPASSEFVWAVTLPGDAEDFARVEAEYLASPERDTAFAGIEPWTVSTDIALVDDALAGEAPLRP